MYPEVLDQLFNLLVAVVIISVEIHYHPNALSQYMLENIFAGGVTSTETLLNIIIVTWQAQYVYLERQNRAALAESM